MAVQDSGNGSLLIFIANALSGNITRFNMTISGGGLVTQSKTTIASGYRHQCDPAALVDAPTGLVYDVKHDLLYVASTLDNAVYSVPQAGSRQSDAGVGQIVYQDATHLHGALALALASNNDLLVSDNDVINAHPNQPSEIVEFTPAGQFVKQLSVDANLGGSFGLNVSVSADGQTARFAAVDDNAVSLNIWTLPTPSRQRNRWWLGPVIKSPALSTSRAGDCPLASACEVSDLCRLPRPLFRRRLLSGLVGNASGLKQRRRQSSVVAGLGDESLVGHLAIEIAHRAIGRLDALDQLVVRVHNRLVIHLPVDGIAPTVTGLYRQMSTRVD